MLIAYTSALLAPSVPSADQKVISLSKKDGTELPVKVTITGFDGSQFCTVTVGSEAVPQKVHYLWLAKDETLEDGYELEELQEAFGYIGFGADDEDFFFRLSDAVSHLDDDDLDDDDDMPVAGRNGDYYEAYVSAQMQANYWQSLYYQKNQKGIDFEIDWFWLFMIVLVLSVSGCTALG